MDAAAGGTSGGAGGGAGSDCEGEDQEDSSSSNSQELADARAALVNLNLQEESKIKEEEDALAYFRQQWQRELVSTPSPQRQLPAVKENPDKQEVEPLPENDEDKAKALFLRGVALERGGKHYEAVQHYKRAVQLLPDVEQQLYDSSERGADTPEVVPETADDPPALEAPPSDEDDQLDGDVDLVARLQRILAKKGRLCDAEFAQRGGHISWLPYEVLLLILRWVVGSHLDAASLERASMTCRGLYLAAREQDIWRTLCIRTWGIDCGIPKAHGFTSWRDMYIDRSRLNLHGVYISKTTYLRHGENAYQDQFYKPWYLIEYYRYLRFFPEGLVLSWTTADEPASCVAHLKHRQTKNLQGIMSGHYRLIGDKVVIVLKKAGNEKKPAQTSNTRFRSRRKDAMHEQQEQIFHLELQLRSTKCRRNWQLQWRGYSVCTRRDQWTSFELHPSKYPPFYFSQVRNYTNETEAPLI